MANLLPVQWKENLERLSEKAARVLEKLKPVKRTHHSLERITEDLLPSFIQSGGPLLDVRESANELIVTAELPGLKKDDFSVELIGRRLLIKGEKKVVSEKKGAGGSYLSECRYGSFARSVQLPYDVTESAINAVLKDGILTIRMPKPDSARKTQYRVTIS